MLAEASASRGDITVFTGERWRGVKRVVAASIASAVEDDLGRLFLLDFESTLSVNVERFFGSLGRFFPFRFDAFDVGVETEDFVVIISFAVDEDVRSCSDLALARESRLIFEFQWFFIALSVLPGKNREIFAHLFPNLACFSLSIFSSSFDQPCFLIDGSN